MTLNSQKIVQHINNFKGKKVLVVGDVMIDAYYWGAVHRISPEAPVPVVDIIKTESRLGGAANVALNLKTLGAEPLICSVIGDDDPGDRMISLMEKRSFSPGGLVRSSGRRTTSKTRIISSGQHLLRVDEEDKFELSIEEENNLLIKIQQQIDNEDVAVIVFEDYNKGVLTERVISETIKLANEKKIPTTVDPKKDHFFDYRSCTLFKPNLKELVEGTKIDVDPDDETELIGAVRELHKRLNNKISLVTLSERGVLISDRDNHMIIPAFKRKILDVSGAGDTVISVASLSLAEGMSLEEIATLSNLAGGLVCESVGVVPIRAAELIEEVEKKF